MMKYTKEQLQGMIDLEVNTVLANLLGFDDIMKYAESHLILNYNLTLPGQELKNVNYCNNPSDIMPLAFEHKIDLNHLNGVWIADHDCMMQVCHEKPLRAMACCLILLLQDKK